MLEEQVLDTARHDRSAFTCGVPELDDFLHRLADQQRRKNITTVHVLVDSAEPGFILGYYTLSAAQVDVSQLAEAERKRLPRYPVPCFRMGRMACHSGRRGEGLGKLMMGCAVDRCLKAREQVAAYALLVDAKDARAKAFYEHYGFVSCTERPLSLYLPLGR